MGFSRRVFLASAASAGALTACGGGGTSPIPGGSSTPTPHASSSPTPSPTPTASPTATPAGTLVFDLTKTDLPAGTQVYAYVIGQIGTTAAYYWFNGSSGGFQQMSQSDNVYSATKYPASMSAANAYQTQLQLSYQSSWADYSIPLTVGQKTSLSLFASAKGLSGLGTGTSALGGRIYLSVGPLKLPITGDPTAPTLPAIVQGPGMYCLFDWMEFSIDSSGTLYLNTTQVDQFGFQLIGSVGNTGVTPNPVGGLSGTREGTIAQVASTMTSLYASNQMTLSPYGGYTYSTSIFNMSVPAIGSGALYPSGVTHLRAVSPKNFCISISGYTPSTAITTYFDSYVSASYSYWQSNVLTVTDGSTVYSAFVPTSGSYSGSLVFYQGTFTLAQLQATYPGTAPTIVLAPPPTLDVFECANSLATGTAAAKDIQKIIAAALNRGIVNSSMNDNATTVSGAYSGANPLPGTSPVWNRWAQAWHQSNLNGFAYGFAYDDVNSQAAVFHETGWGGSDYATITLGTFLSTHLTNASARSAEMVRRQFLLRH